MWNRLHGAFHTFIWKLIYILLAMDYVYKYLEAIACPINDANTVVGFIQKNILSKFGAPRTIISDE